MNDARTLHGGASTLAKRITDAAIRSVMDAPAARDWPQIRLGDSLLQARYGTSEKTSDDPSGVPIFRMGNIQDGRLNTDNLKYLHLSDVDRDQLLLIPGDILLNRTNSPELVGKCAVFDRVEEFGFASYLIRLRLDPSRALPHFVAYYINSTLGRRYMFAGRKQMTGQANVNTATIAAMPLPLPDIARQQLLVSYFDRVRSVANEVEAALNRRQEELDALLPSILGKAFTGGL